MKNIPFIIKTLTDIGFSENEAQVYIAVLSLGETTVLQIARITEIKRTTVYHILESLQQKNLIMIQIKGFKKFFVAENPEHLSDIIHTRTKIFQQVLPELTAAYRTKNKKGSIREHIGLQSVKKIYEDLLKELNPHDNYYILSNQQEWYSLDKDFFQKFIEKRAKLSINIKLLLINSPAAQEAYKFQKNYNQTVKILPKETNLSTNLVITPNKVIIHKLNNPISALVITDPAIIQMHKESFEIMWKNTLS